MANPFTSFAFPASGAGVTTNITLPTRLAYIINVKDCGAKGDGVTDDLPAITTAINVVAGRNKGTIYFPPGTYLVSAPITWAASQGGVNTVRWLGEYGLSVITGNFSDFIFKYNGGDQFNIWEKLTISNTNATGGGVLISSDSNNQAFRDCIFICNQGLSNASVGGGGPLDQTIENCDFTYPVGGQTNSFGLATECNGPVVNCRFIGLDYGILAYGQEGAMNFVGCYFEQCKNGFCPGLKADLVTADDGTIFLLGGCYFKNCSTALNFHNPTSGASIFGIRIEGNDGQFRGGNCQYGLLADVGGFTASLMAGVVITGNFDQAAVYFGNSTGSPPNLMGVSASNGSSTVGNKGAWYWFDTTNAVAAPGAYLPTLAACNTSLVYPTSGLPGFGFHSGSGSEGDEYNVSDGTNSLAWGAALTNTGTHTTHYLVRNNSTTPASPNFTVMGQ